MYIVSGVTPQSLMLNFLGLHVLGRDIAVYSGSVIDVFGRIDVSEEAVRSTLTRMTSRGLLAKHRNGRKVYFGLTPRATEVLEDGERRIWQTGAVNRDWDGTWTLVAFSLPEGRRGDRHDLRSQTRVGRVSAWCRTACGSHRAPVTSPRWPPVST